MRRRELLAGLGAIAGTGIAGCAGYWNDDDASQGPWVTTDVAGPIERQSIRFYQPRRARAVRRLRVAWDEAASAVHITGRMSYGSSTCDRPGIAETRYDADADRLFVELTPTRREGVRRCSADIAVDTYRATVVFEETLPASVHVVSGSHEHADATPAERTVDRAEQRDLCTSDHPEGSDAAEKAHWTCPEKFVRAEQSRPERTPTATPEE